MCYIHHPTKARKEYIANNQQNRANQRSSNRGQQLVNITDSKTQPPATTANRLSKGDPMTTKRNPKNRNQQRKQLQDAYVVGFYEAMYTRFGNRETYKGQNVDDVVQFAVVELMKRITYVMGKYPNPAYYAAARFNNVVTDYQRRQSAQAGSGALGQRRWESSANEKVAEAIESISFDCSEDWADSMDKMSLIKEIFGVLGVQEQKMVHLSAKGYSVTEIAKQVSLRRETVSKKMSKVRSTAKTFRPAA